MALLFIDSFDHYQQAEVTAKWSGASGASGGDQQGYSIRAGEGRCGTAALMMGRLASVYRGFPFAAQTAMAGFACRIASVFTDPERAFTLLRLNNATGDGGWLASLAYNPDGSLQTVVGFAGGSVIVGSTPPNTIHQDVWYFLEWGVTVGDSSTGAHRLRVNGVPLVTATGVNTVPASVTGGTVPRQFEFVSSGFAGGQQFYIDDFYALDETGPAPWNTFLGDCRVEYLRPRAAGAQQQWSVTGAASHWAAVDDNATPDEDTTYIEATTAGLTDTQRYQATGLPAGTLFGAQLSLYASKTEVGPRTLAPVVNAVVGTAVGPSQSSYAYFSAVSPTNPATGVAWTPATINAIDCGVTVVS